jgi:hypothetical protein
MHFNASSPYFQDQPQGKLVTPLFPVSAAEAAKKAHDVCIEDGNR